jgi:hypothetical protein
MNRTPHLITAVAAFLTGVLATLALHPGNLGTPAMVGDAGDFPAMGSIPSSFRADGTYETAVEPGLGITAITSRDEQDTAAHSLPGKSGVYTLSPLFELTGDMIERACLEHVMDFENALSQYSVDIRLTAAAQAEMLQVLYRAGEPLVTFKLGAFPAQYGRLDQELVTLSVLSARTPSSSHLNVFTTEPLYPMLRAELLRLTGTAHIPRCESFSVTRSPPR